MGQRRRRRIVGLVLRATVVTALFALAVPALALDVQLLTAHGDAKAPLSLRLEPLSLRDLLTADGLTMPSPRREAYASLGGLVASGVSVVLADVAPSIERELPLRWQVRLPLDRSLADLRVVAELVSSSGLDRLHGGDRGEVGIPVLARVEGPWVQSMDERFQIVEGTVVLQMATASFGQRSGTYEADLILRADER